MQAAQTAMMVSTLGRLPGSLRALLQQALERELVLDLLISTVCTPFLVDVSVLFH
jgi:hypothetical protein